MLWTVRHNLILKEYFPITESSRQRFIWVHRNKKQTDKSFWYNSSSLANCNIGNYCTITVRNKFNTLQETSEIHILNHNKCENFISIHIEKAAECIPIKPQTKCRVPWESITGKKWDNMKKAFLFNKRNSTNTNVYKLKKA